MKVVKRPIPVEAVQLDPVGEHRLKLPDGVRGVPSGGADNWAYDGCRFFVDAVEGTLECVAGDWIITDADGYHSVVRPDRFEKTYRQIDVPADPAERFIDVTDDDIVDELKRRWKSLVVVTQRPDLKKIENEDEIVVFYRGGLTMALGLLTRALAQMKHYVCQTYTHENDPKPKPEDGE